MTANSMEAAARALGLKLYVFNAGTEGDFDGVFSELSKLSGLWIANETFFANRSERLAGLASRYAIPAVHQSREFTLAGGLMSYGGSIAQSHREWLEPTQDVFSRARNLQTCRFSR